MQIPLKEEDRGAKVEEIGGETEGDFTDNSNVSLALQIFFFPLYLSTSTTLMFRASGVGVSIVLWATRDHSKHAHRMIE